MAKARGKKSKASRSKSNVTRKSVKKPAKKKATKKRYMRQAEAQVQQVMSAKDVWMAGTRVELGPSMQNFVKERASQLVKDWPNMTQPMKVEWKNESKTGYMKDILSEAKTIASGQALIDKSPASFKQAMEIATMAEDKALASNIVKTQGEMLANKFPEPKTDEPAHAAGIGEAIRAGVEGLRRSKQRGEHEGRE